LRPLILVTNDDSIHSKGIEVLAKVMSKIGDVVVVAPDSHQSGMSHAITINHYLRLKKSKVLGKDFEAYECSGTPADCVKIAKHEILKSRKIDLVVSGINHGLNASISVIYSGTMAAVFEAGIEKIPAVGFSIDDFRSDADFDHVEQYIEQIASWVLGQEEKQILNVNFPKKQEQPPQGIKICVQNNGNWIEEFEKRTDPNGKNYYWMGGGFQDNEPENKNTDIWAINHNYVSIVPCKIDFTDFDKIEKLKNIFD
jgi:5'-nucleotidase